MTQEQTRELSVHPFYRTAVVDGYRVAKNDDGEEIALVDLTFSSEFGVERHDFWDGPYLEILDHSPSSVRLDRLESGAPFLMDHDTRSQAGIVEAAEITGDRLGRATIRLSPNAVNLPGYGNVEADIKSGIRTNVSVGYRIYEAVVAVERRDGPDEIRVTDWQPFEISSVSVPADPTVGVDRSAEHVRTDLKPNRLLIRGLSMDENENKSSVADDLLAAVEKSNTRMDDMSVRVDSISEQIANIGGTAQVRDNSGKPAGNVEDKDITTKRERERIARVNETADQVRKLPGVDSEKLEELTRNAVSNGDEAADFFRDAMALSENVEVREHNNGPDMLGLERKQIENYSVMRAAYILERQATGVITPADAKRCGLELEVHRAAVDQWNRSGHEPKGILIPDDVLHARIYPIEATGLAKFRSKFGRRDLTVGAGTVSNLVETAVDAVSFIDLLYARLALLGLGARTISGLTGDLALPRMSGGSTVTYVAENVAASESTPTFDQVSLTPKTATTYVDISRKSMLQSNPAVEALVMDDLARQFALRIDLSGIAGNPDLTATADDPRGILYTTGIGASTNDTDMYNMVTELESLVAIQNADVGSLGFLTNPQVRKVLRRAKIDSGSGELVWPPGAQEIIGYPVATTTQVPSNLGTSNQSACIFGNFNDLIIAFWSGLDIIRDPYSLSTQGALRIAAFQDHDVAVRHAESFAAAQDIVTT